MSITRTLWGVCSALLLGTICTAGARAQLKPPYVEYAAKFTCGQENVDEPDDVVSGAYASSISIHNPQSALAVVFVKKIVVARPERSEFAPPYITRDVLKADQADRVDCHFIRTALKLPSATTYVEGFVVLEVPRQGAQPFQPVLDVVAKYTARPIKGYVSTETVAQIEGKSISR